MIDGQLAFTVCLCARKCIVKCTFIAARAETTFNQKLRRYIYDDMPSACPCVRICRYVCNPSVCLSVCLSQSVAMLCRVLLPHIRIQAFTAGDDALSLVAQTNGVILVNENRM